MGTSVVAVRAERDDRKSLAQPKAHLIRSGVNPFLPVKRILALLVGPSQREHCYKDYNSTTAKRKRQAKLMLISQAMQYYLKEYLPSRQLKALNLK